MKYFNQNCFCLIFNQIYMQVYKVDIRSEPNHVCRYCLSVAKAGDATGAEGYRKNKRSHESRKVVKIQDDTIHSKSKLT